MATIDLDDHAGPRRRFDATMASGYLTLGHVPALRTAERRRAVTGGEEVVDALADELDRSLTTARGEVGLLLDGGIAGAVLAALVPPSTPCYTVVADAPGVADPSHEAAAQAARWGHPHLTIAVSWTDHLTHIGNLLARKGAPLHRSEVPHFLAAQVADADGVGTLVTATGAEEIFGGAPELFVPDPTFDEFVGRATVVDPTVFLDEPVDPRSWFERQRAGDEIDVARFLREVRAPGLAAAHRHALGAAGATMVAPYLAIEPTGPLDLRRIRSGEAMPAIAEAYRFLHDTTWIPALEQSPSPMDVWLSGWVGPGVLPGLRDDVLAAFAAADGDQRWLLWCLAAFVQLDERAPAARERVAEILAIPEVM